MSSSQYVLIVVCVTTLATTSAHSAFVAQPDGSLLESFNDGVVDTVTWTKSTISGPLAVSETGTELKIVQTLGFNGAYSTFANGIDESTGLSDGSGLVEPKTAGNNNHRLRAVMRRRDPFDDRVAMGLSITTNRFLRTCGDVGDYACLVWNATGTTGQPQSTVPVGQIDPRSEISIQIRNADGPTGTPLHAEVNAFVLLPDGVHVISEPPQLPMYDWTGKTRYAFEIDWKTTTSANFKVEQVRRPDQNNDLATDIVDFGVFAGDFGKSGSGGDLNWDGTFSDFDDSGTVDIADFGQLAGAFGQDPIMVLEVPADWSLGSPDLQPGNELCADGSCWPSSLGAQIYAHNIGTLWVDYVQVFGDGTESPEHTPEPATLVLLGIAGLALMRHRRGA